MVSLARDDYRSVCGETHWQRSLSRGDWNIRTVTRTRLSSSETQFYIRADLDAYETDKEGERRVFSKSGTEPFAPSASRKVPHQEAPFQTHSRSIAANV